MKKNKRRGHNEAGTVSGQLCVSERRVGEGRASDYRRVLRKTWLGQWGVLRQGRARRGRPHGAELGQHWHR